MKPSTIYLGCLGAFVAVVFIGTIVTLGFIFMDNFGSHPVAVVVKDPVVGKYKIRFGVVQLDTAGNPYLAEETATIPFKVKTSMYGVEITPPNSQPYTYHCVFHLSAVPKVISGDAYVGKEPSDTLETNEVSVTSGRTVDTNWFDPGDPVGEQTVEVFINHKLAATIKYTVTPEVLPDTPAAPKAAPKTTPK